MEETRSEKYLLSNTTPELMQLLTTVLVENNADLIRMEVSQMISSYDHESLKLMYSLLDRVEDGVKPIVNGEDDFSLEYIVFKYLCNYYIKCNGFRNGK